MDFQNLPVNPGLVLAVALYGGASAYITGPELTAREIANSSWPDTCASRLLEDLEATRTPPEVIPEMPDMTRLLNEIHPDLGRLLASIPDPNAAARDAARRAQAAEDARIARAADGIEDHCLCAVAVYSAEERLGIGLWAASARIITTPAVRDRDIGLSRTLRSPACQLIGGA
ncbi:MAG: hypothetical protein AAGF94_18935 [Pseudomonadota bacterium]